MEAALANSIEVVSLASLKPANRNARTHSKKQINQIAASMKRFGFTNPVLIDGDNIIVAGHGRYAAANALGLKEAPCIRIGSMTPAEKRAYAIADNAIAAKSGWDKELLALELGELIDLGFDMELTGFEMPEIDQLLVDVAEESPKAPAREDLVPAPHDGAPTSRPGDLWLLGRHRLMCGDAKDWSAMALLMGSERAHMVFTDPPYNLKIEGVVSGRGKAKHGDFVEASGELTPEEFTAFLAQALRSMAPACKDGAILFVCMDWRHISELLAAGREAALELKNMCVWVKTNGGQGAFYRSKHELVTVWKHGKAEHTNTFGLGEGGRSRTNVWQYAGANAFKVERSEELAMHPTAKPVAMVADAIRDVTHRNEIVLDPFGGSGTTLIAAQKTGRHARLMELDPAYCDTIIRRWEAFTGKNAVLASSGQCFEAVADERKRLQSRVGIGKLHNTLRRSIYMSNDGSDGDEKFGPGRPPKDHQFKKGAPSPNPRGRPRKRPRIPAPIERTIDIIQSMERPVRTSTGKIPFSQANLEMIKRRASEGHAPSQRYLDKIFREALSDFNKEHPQLTRKFDQLSQAMVRGDPPQFVLDALAVLAEEYRLALLDPKGDPTGVEKRIHAASRARYERITAYLKQQGLINAEAE